MTRRHMLIATLAVTSACGGCSFREKAPDGSGTIECTQVQISPQVGGRIARLPVREGAAVKKGDLLAELDRTDYELKLNEARAGMEQAQAQLDMMLAGSRDEDVQRARAQVHEAEAAAAAAAADLARVLAVFEKGSATQKQRDDAKANADRTAAAVAGAQQVLSRLQNGSRQEEIRIARSQVELAKARVAQAEKAVDYCSVAAPMDGTVTTRNREEGEMVGPGATLMSLSRLDEVWLSVYVPEPSLLRLKLGQPARVKVDGSSGEHKGTVTFIASEAEFTPRNVQTRDERAKLVYRVKVSLANPDGIFKPGMPADAYLEGGE